MRSPDGSGLDPVHAEPDAHGLVLYDDERLLVETTAAYLGDALRAGEPAIALATRAHLTAIEQELGPLAQGAGYTGIDAHTFLDQVSVDGAIETTTFLAAVSEVIDEASSGGGRPRIFGELVAVLLKRGEVDSVLHVEDLWNELGGSCSFDLLCGYPTAGVDHAPRADLSGVLRAKHSSFERMENVIQLSGPNGSKRYGLMDPTALSQRIGRFSKGAQPESPLFARAREKLHEKLENVGLHSALVGELSVAAGLILGWLAVNTAPSGSIGVDVERDDHDVYFRFDVPCGAGITAPNGVEVLHALGGSGSLSMDFEEGTLLTVLQHPIIHGR